MGYRRRQRMSITSNRVRLMACAQACVLLAASAIAGNPAVPSLSVGSAIGPPGSVRTVAVAIESGGSNLGGVQFELVVPVMLHVDPSSASGPGMGVGVVCSNPMPDRLICLAFNNSGGALPARFAINVDFRVDVAAAFGIAPLNLSNVEFSDPAGLPLASGSNSNGVFQIVEFGPPVFSSQPAAELLIDFGNVLHGEFVDRTVRISNIALPGSQSLTLDSCVISGSSAFALQQPTVFPLTLTTGSVVDLSVRVNSNIGLPSMVQGVLSCQLQGGLLNPSWPLLANAVPDLVFANGLE
jgi:hypothetical protein